MSTNYWINGTYNKPGNSSCDPTRSRRGLESACLFLLGIVHASYNDEPCGPHLSTFFFYNNFYYETIGVDINSNICLYKYATERGGKKNIIKKLRGF